MKFGGFHVKSWDIAFPQHSIKLKFFLNYLIYKVLQMDFTLDFVWNPPDFMKSIKSAGFHMKSGNMSFWVITKYRSFFWKAKYELHLYISNWSNIKDKPCSAHKIGYAEKASIIKKFYLMYTPSSAYYITWG